MEGRRSRFWRTDYEEVRPLVHSDSNCCGEVYQRRRLLAQSIQILLRDRPVAASQDQIIDALYGFVFYDELQRGTECGLIHATDLLGIDQYRSTLRSKPWFL